MADPTPTPTDPPSPKPPRRAQIAVACNRCRGRKTKCDGARPTCSSCQDHGASCNYVADADATPIIALKRKAEALQQQCNEYQELIQSLVSVTDVNSSKLLARLRDGEAAASVIQSAVSMQRHHRWQGSQEFLLPSPSPGSHSATAMEIPSDNRQSRGSVSLEPPGASRVVFEPKIDVVPAPPSYFHVGDNDPRCEQGISSTLHEEQDNVLHPRSIVGPNCEFLGPNRWREFWAEESLCTVKPRMWTSLAEPAPKDVYTAPHGCVDEASGGMDRVFLA